MNRRHFLLTNAVLLANASGASAESRSFVNADAKSRTRSTTYIAPALPTLSLHAEQAGTLPYMAAVYPLEGAVPSGSTVASSDEPSLAASVLSRWPDGSAAVVVVAGEANVTATSVRAIALRATTASAAALTPARVSALVRDVSIDAGALSTVTVSRFSAPQRIWWSNASVICCRYRAAVNAALEAVIDIHAFAGDRALVEVVIENSSIDASAAQPARPATQTYDGLIVSVNGQQIARVASPAPGQPYQAGRGGGRYAGGHEAFRAWYCATWVGGDPRVEVTHDAASLQAHPLFFRCWKDAPDDYRRAYQNDAYVPWSAGRINVPAMPSGGDIEAIGPLTQWDARYVQTGSRHVRRAVVASALGALSCNINVRDAASGFVPTLAQSASHSQQDGTWPNTATEPSWELAHHPAVGLTAFLCQPSPLFIEIVQKIALWNATSTSKDGVFGFWSQVRGKAWGIRSLAHAIFLTPDGDRWKAPAQASLAANARLIDTFRTSPNAALGFVWYPAPTKCADFESRNEGMQQPLWMHHFLVLSLHAADRTKLLRGAAQTLLTKVTDWAVLQPVRYVNESAGGEWRLHNYLTTVGRATVTTATGDNLGSGIYAGPTFDALPTYAQNLAWYYTDAPPDNAGAFIAIETNPGRNPNYRLWKSARDASAAGVSYASIFWAALTVAVERGVPGADTAWNKVVGGITNLPRWADGFTVEPRYNRYPRNR